MTHSGGRRFSFICLMVLVVVSAAPLMAAGPVVHDVTGAWHGFFQSSLTGMVGTFKVDISSQQHRRFVGSLYSPHPAIMPPTLVIPFQGTQAASLRFNVVGKNDVGWMFVANGDGHPLGDGSAWAMSDYTLKSRFGSRSSEQSAMRWKGRT